jgi:hypothetical protein
MLARLAVPQISARPSVLSRLPSYKRCSAVTRLESKTSTCLSKQATSSPFRNIDIQNTRGRDSGLSSKKPVSRNFPSVQNSTISFPFIFLQAVLPTSKMQLVYFQATANSFAKTPGSGGGGGSCTKSRGSLLSHLPQPQCGRTILLAAGSLVGWRTRCHAQFA